jgi:oxalate decarboxylase/phosphoglucose isomerase-like protein (cupin superfamily)
MAEMKFLELMEEISEDSRGLVFFPWRNRLSAPPEILRTFHLVSIQPGQERGHHLHPGFAEWLFPFHGDGVLLWEAPTGEVQERLIRGNRTLVHIPPGVAHALRNPGPELLYLLAWREPAGTGPTDPETLPHPLRPPQSDA